MNSDPVLDLGDMARTMSPRLRNCLSSPLLSNDALVGVLTLYSAGPENFNEDHRRIIEAVARQTAHPLKRAVDSDVSVGRDLLTLLPNFSQLEQLANTGDQSTIFSNSFLTLMLIDVIGLKRVNIEYGRGAGDEVLRHVARSVRSEIHLPDILFRYRSDEFLALVHSEDARAVEALSRRITETIRQNQLVLQTGTAITVDIAVTCVSAPHDGRSLRDLLAAVRIPLPSPVTPQGSRVH
jgi:diguanylate cyclase (GGDEF)-like protein